MRVLPPSGADPDLDVQERPTVNQHSTDRRQQTFAEIAARASTLDERVRRWLPGASAAFEGAADPPGAVADSPGEGMLATWAGNLAVGCSAPFSRRLAWDGIDVNGLVHAVQPPPPVSGSLPDWMVVLLAAYRWDRDGGELDGSAVDQCQSPAPAPAPGPPMPFQELLLPLVEHARAEIARRTPATHHGLSPEAHQALERTLLARLTRICAQPLYLAFAAFRERAAADPGLDSPPSAPQQPLYHRFLGQLRGRGMLALFREYSVAARLCATTTTNWILFVAEFMDRLADDRKALQGRFGDGSELGPVAAIEGELSDAHDGGKGVLVCRFGNGMRLVYKPRSVALEEFFAELVEWLNDTRELLPLRAVNVLSLPTHGWVEWIAPQACTEEVQVQRFYRRCGMHLAVLHALHGSDFHSGNLLASGEHPVLIDAEGLLTHKFELEAAGRQGTPPIVRFFDDIARDSVGRVLLLPWLKVTSDGQAVDLGGLSMTPPAKQTVEVLTWCDVNGDSMHLAPVEVPSSAPRNLPLLSDQTVVAGRYLEEVLAGFQQMYDLLLAQRENLLAPGGLIERLGPQPVRFIFRHTSLYASLLERTFHPKFLRDGASRTIELDVLARPLVQVPERPAVWPLLAEERRALEQVDVPLFATRADSRGIQLSSGESVECFHSSAASEARRKLQSLGPADRIVQQQMIRASFAAVASAGLATAEPSPPDCPGNEPQGVLVTEGKTQRRARAMSEATRISQVVAGLARRHEGTPFWSGPAYHPAARRHNASDGRPGLLDGSAGIALGLAAVAATTARPDLAAMARASLLPLCGPLLDVAPRLARGTWDPGIGTGAASCAYGLLRCSQLLDDAGLLEAACRWAALLDPAGLSPKGSNDILSGRAGALLLLVRLHAATGDQNLLLRAVRFADDLLARRVTDSETGFKVWVTRWGSAEAGLAHGQSGIAYAIAEAAAAAQRPDLRDAACEAIGYERHLLGADFSGLAAGDRMAAWSHGSAGLGLVRAAMLRTADDPELRRDLEAAVERTRQHLLVGLDDLCSGALGRIELLDAAADPLARPS